MPDPVEPVAPRIAKVLVCAEERLALYDAPVCRAFVHPGATAPHDVCETTADGRDGQLWVAVQRVYPVSPFPTQDVSAQRCHPDEFAADVLLGTVRCTPTVDDQGRPPAAGAVTDAAFRSLRDAAILREALLCCVVNEDTDPGVFRLGAWTPLGPQGGCAGGQWAATVRIPACPCPD